MLYLPRPRRRPPVNRLHGLAPLYERYWQHVKSWPPLAQIVLLAFVVQSLLFAYVGWKYANLCFELHQAFDGLGFKSASFKLLEESRVQLIFNTHAGDLQLTLEQCRLHPSAVFCTDTELEEVSCRQIVTRYPYGKFSYKKLQCLEYVHSISPHAGIVLADIDTVLPCVHPSPQYGMCIRAERAIVDDKNDVYYAFNTLDRHRLSKGWYNICLGAYIYLPNKLVTLSLVKLSHFEHFGADDLAFTYFFDKLEMDVRSISNLTASSTRKCDAVDSLTVAAIQCNFQDIVNMRLQACSRAEWP